MFCVDDQIDVLCVFKRRSLLLFQEGGVWLALALE